jgi:hypothetical protein
VAFRAAHTAGGDAMKDMAMSGKLSKAEERAVKRLQRKLTRESGYPVEWDEAVACWQREYAKKWRECRLASMMARQREEIQRHKWIESEKAHRDLGQAAVLDWIHHHAAEWRDWYENHTDEEM